MSAAAATRTAARSRRRRRGSRPDAAGPPLPPIGPSLPHVRADDRGLRRRRDVARHDLNQAERGGRVSVEGASRRGNLRLALANQGGGGGGGRGGAVAGRRRTVEGEVAPDVGRKKKSRNDGKRYVECSHTGDTTSGDAASARGKRQCGGEGDHCVGEGRG